MTQTEITDLQTQYIEKIRLIFSQESIDVPELREIVLSIHRMKASDRVHFENVYIQLSNLLFSRDVILPELNYEIFSEKVDVSETELTVTIADNFEFLFRQLIISLQKYKNLLRRHLIFKLGDNTQSSTELVLIYDFHSKDYLFEKIQSQIGSHCRVLSIEELKIELESNKKNDIKSYLCFLSLLPNNSSYSEIQKYLEDIQALIPLNLLSNIDYELQQPKLYNLTDKIEEIKNEIKCLIAIELFNEDIVPNMTKAIKQLFLKKDVHSLEYKILSEGHSGSMVILLQPYKNTGTHFKCVIKVNTTPEGKQKLLEEISNYENVDGLDSFYRIDYKEVDNHIAIMYPYASTNAVKISNSFAEYYQKNTSNKCINVVDMLFNIDLFAQLKETSPVIKTVKDLYSSYLNEAKIFSKIKQIDPSSSTELYNDYKKILDYSLNTKVKTCHGDLHTNNFFYDGEKVFLIDFGHTKKDLHSVLDFTTLESSIKFKHIPFYISIDELLKIENELLDVITFKPDFKFKEIKREDLKKPFEIIHKIRVLSKQYDSSSNHLDYFISLFVLTIRQVQYDNMHQLYAFRSSEKLAKKILSLIK